jgi:hypothetical protein
MASMLTKPADISQLRGTIHLDVRYLHIGLTT